jgi:hypothetical protein
MFLPHPCIQQNSRRALALLAATTVSGLSTFLPRMYRHEWQREGHALGAARPSASAPHASAAKATSTRAIAAVKRAMLIDWRLCAGDVCVLIVSLCVNV